MAITAKGFTNAFEHSNCTYRQQFAIHLGHRSKLNLQHENNSGLSNMWFTVLLGLQTKKHIAELKQLSFYWNTSRCFDRTDFSEYVTKAVYTLLSNNLDGTFDFSCKRLTPFWICCLFETTKIV